MTTVRALLQAKGVRVFTTTPEASIKSALRLMADKDIGALPVLQGKSLVGILSERDCARRVLLAGKPADTTTVTQAMTSTVIAARPEYTLEACMAIMTNKHIRHLPVLDGDQLVGIITIGDVVKEIIARQESALQRMENLITGIPEESI